MLDGVVDPLSSTAPKSGQRVDSSKITDAQLEAANSALLGQAKGFQDNFNQSPTGVCSWMPPVRPGVT